MNFIRKIREANIVMGNEKPAVSVGKGTEERVGSTHTDVQRGRFGLTNRRTQNLAIRKKDGKRGGCVRTERTKNCLEILAVLRKIVRSAMEKTGIKTRQREALEQTKNYYLKGSSRKTNRLNQKRMWPRENRQRPKDGVGNHEYSNRGRREAKGQRSAGREIASESRETGSQRKAIRRKAA